MLMGFRFITSGLIMMSLLKAQGKFEKPTVKDIFKNALYGTLLLVGGTGSVMWAEQYVQTGIASIVVCSLPFWFLVLDYPKWKENFSNVTALLGLFVGFFGVYMLFEGSFSDLSEHFVLGISSIIIGGILWALGSLFSRYHPTSMPLLMNVSFQFTSAGILCLIISFFLNETDNFHFANVSLISWLSTFYLSVFGVLAYGAYIWLITKRSLIQVGTYVYINPIIAIFLGWMFANEIISPKQLIALFVILSGVVLVNWNGYRTKIFRKKETIS